MILDHLNKLDILDGIPVADRAVGELEYHVANISYSDDGTFKYQTKVIAINSGASLESNNQLVIYRKDTNGNYIEIQTINDIAPKYTEQGTCVVSAVDGLWLYVSHAKEWLGSVPRNGAIRIYKYNPDTSTYTLKQTFTNPDSGQYRYFGVAMTVTNKGKFLFVSAHDIRIITTFKLDEETDLYVKVHSYYHPGEGNFGADLISVEDESLLVGNMQSAYYAAEGRITELKIAEDGSLSFCSDIISPYASANGLFGLSMLYDSATRNLIAYSRTGGNEVLLLTFKRLGSGSFKYIGYINVDERMLGTKLVSLAGVFYLYDVYVYGTSPSKRVISFKFSNPTYFPPVEQVVVHPTLLEDNYQFQTVVRKENKIAVYDLLKISGSSGNRFGAGLAISANGEWLFVGSDNINSGKDISYIHRYRRDDTLGWVYIDSLKGVYKSTNGNNFFGRSFSVNADGTVLAVGLPYGNGAGKVLVYTVSNVGYWLRETIDMAGRYPNVSQSGHSVVINAKGDELFVGADARDLANSAVINLKYVNGVWTNGQVINNIASGFGLFIALSPDEKRLAISASLHGDGKTHLFKLMDGVWVKFHQIAALNNFCGQGLSFGRDGNELFIGSEATAFTYRFNQKGSETEWEDANYAQAHRFGIGTNQYCSAAIVYDKVSNQLIGGDYRYKLSGTVEKGAIHIWDNLDDVLGNVMPRVATIESPPVHSQTGIGKRMAISKDGLYVAVCSEINHLGVKCGMVSIFKFVDGNYVHQYNLENPSPTANTRFGHRITFSGDGKTLFVSNPQWNANDVGRVHVYRMVSDKWWLVQNIDGNAGTNKMFGGGIASNYDGSCLYISFNRDGDGTAGPVQVQRYILNGHTYVALPNTYSLIAANTDGAGGTAYDITASGDGKTIAVVVGRSATMHVYTLDTISGKFEFQRSIPLATVTGNLHDLSVCMDNEGENTFVSVYGSTESHTKLFHVHRQDFNWEVVNISESNYGKIDGFDGPTFTMSSDGNFIGVGLGTATNGVALRYDSDLICPKVYAMKDILNLKAYDGNEYYSEMEDALISSPIIPVKL